jgi:hypothetical protein
MRDGRLNVLSAQQCELQCKAAIQNQFSFLKFGLVGPVAGICAIAPNAQVRHHRGRPKQAIRSARMPQAQQSSANGALLG